MKKINLPVLGSIPRLGFGCMGMSEFYGPAQDEKKSLAVLHAAYEAGIRMFDTADFYGDGKNEKLLASFLVDVGDDVIIASKCGIVRSDRILDDGNFQRQFNGRPEYIKTSCENSLLRLNIEQIDLFYLHRVDPETPIEESVGALSYLVKEGKVRAIGLSEASLTQINKAHAIHPLTAIQSEYSIWTRDNENEILPLCRKLNIAFIPYAPLGRGIMSSQSGRVNLSFPKNDFRNTLERSTEQNLSKNQHLTDYLYKIGKKYNLSAFQVCLAWLLAQGNDILPIPGMRRMSSLESNIIAEQVSFSQSDIDLLSKAFGQGRVSGGRYTIDKNIT